MQQNEQKEQFLVNMQLPGIELMRLSLATIEFVAKKKADIIGVTGNGKSHI